MRPTRAPHTVATLACRTALVSLLFMAVPSPGPAVAPSRPAAATQPASRAEKHRHQRGIDLRKVLLDTLEQAYRNDGAWPERLPGTSPPALAYFRPTAPQSAPFAERFASATAVVHERIEVNPDGVWVGFADGHLEFASSASNLAGAKAQLPILQRAVAEHGDPMDGSASKVQAGGVQAGAKPSTRPAGGLKLKVLDPDGKPVAGAWVGDRGRFGDLMPPAERVAISGEGKEEPAITDSEGRATIAASRVFGANFSGPPDKPAAALYALHQARGLVALEDLRPSEFGRDTVREVRLHAACRIVGKVTSLALHEHDRSLAQTTAILYRPGQFGIRGLGSASASQEFEFLVPPGDYGLFVRGTDSYYSHRYVRLEPDNPKLELQLDVQPFLTAQLLGRPAPELRSIKGWKNGQPVTLDRLRGKVVLLDFWGHWCGPCIGSMPELMKLHYDFSDKGLIIIAVHDDSAASIEDMDAKLEWARKNAWNGRDLPFLVALDGGGPTRIPYTATTARGATTAAYGIISFPTTLLISSDGVVLRRVDLRGGQARSEIERLLSSKVPSTGPATRPEH